MELEGQTNTKSPTRPGLPTEREVFPLATTGVEVFTPEILTDNTFSHFHPRPPLSAWGA
ncbi:hypothetical protein J6590_107892, partial [Homalodisca vitripennis]